MINILRSRVRVIFHDDIGEDRRDIAQRAHRVVCTHSSIFFFFFLPSCHFPHDKAFDTIRPTVVVSRASQPEFNLRRDRERISNVFIGKRPILPRPFSPEPLAFSFPFSYDPPVPLIKLFYVCTMNPMNLGIIVSAVDHIAD